MPATSIYAGASRRDACSLFAGGFVATETLVFLNIFDIFYVSSRRSDAFYSAVERTVEPKLPTARRLLNHLTIASCGVGLPQ